MFFLNRIIFFLACNVFKLCNFFLFFFFFKRPRSSLTMPFLSGTLNLKRKEKVAVLWLPFINVKKRYFIKCIFIFTILFSIFTCVWRYHFRNKDSCVLCICAGNDAAVTEWMVSFKHFFKLVHCHVKFHSCSCIQHIHLRVGECPSLLLIKVTFQKLGVNRNNSK